jgi:hypothetical protein
VKVPPRRLQVPAILAERDWLIAQPFFKPERQALLDRLCKASPLSPRIEGPGTIWHQLSKHSPTIARPLLIKKWSDDHQVTPDEKWTNQELALQMAFRSAFFLAISDVAVRTFTVSEQREMKGFYRKKVQQFQEEASLLENFEEAAEHARALAKFYEWIGNDSLFLPNPSLVVRRHQIAPHVRGYCILLGNFMRIHYGRVLREIVARIATAAFNKDVSKEDVRYWCK